MTAFTTATKVVKAPLADADAGCEQAELLQLDALSLRVSDYLATLLPLPLLRERLRQVAREDERSYAQQAHQWLEKKTLV